MRVGNDVVDLTEADTRPGALHARFAARVLAPTEMAAVVLARDATHRLWIYWAAKESAFKVFRKLRPALRFVPRRLLVTLGQPFASLTADSRETQDRVSADLFDTPHGMLPSPGARVASTYTPACSRAPEPGQRCAPGPRGKSTLHFGIVRWGKLIAAVSVEYTRGYIHALARVPAYPFANQRSRSSAEACWRVESGVRRLCGVADGAAPVASVPGGRSGHDACPSALSLSDAGRRFLIARIAAFIGCPPEHLSIPRPRQRGLPPAIFLAGRLLPVDVSLSHHGSLVAFSFAWRS